ncbi:MAG: lysylphosphatidylglycerol synthase transmembrane domain-containing protein [Owenweeksia sp.]
MKNKSKLLLGIVGILISVVAIVYLVRSFDFEKVFTDLKQVKLHYLIILPVIYMLSHILRAGRWMLMLGGKVKMITSLKAILLGFAGNNVLPARGGELVRMQYFSRQTQSSRVTVLSSILFEKILDGLILIGILWVSIFFNRELFDDNATIRSVAVTASLIFFLGFAFLIILRNYHAKVMYFLKNKVGEDKPFVLKLESILDRIFEAVHFVRFNRATALVFVYSLLIWMVEGAVFIMIPSSPGYIGVFQGLIVFALSVLGVVGEQSVSAAILIHASQFLPVTLIGLIIFFSESVKLTNKTVVNEN